MHYYDQESLARALKRLEGTYGFSSDEFYRLHADDDPAVSKIQGFTRHVWADLYLNVCRMSGDEPVELSPDRKPLLI